MSRRQRESCALLMQFVPPIPHFILALNPAPNCGNLYLLDRIGCVELDRFPWAERVRKHSHI